MLTVLILSSLLAATQAGRSPNADFVQLRARLENWSSRYSNDIIEDALLDAPGLISKYGYPLEVHSVTTEDGYILEAHRIPHGRDSNSQPGSKPAVLLMHGLLSSSADWVVLGPGNALAYLLAEEGYDVWLGNARGNYYSRNHVSLDPDQRADFWHFSWEEIGLYDVPALVDHILKTTGQEKLHYIGHSQGGTAFFVLNSLRTEYNDKFISFQGFAPAAFFYNNEHSIYNFLANYETVIESLAFQLGFTEIARNSRLLTWLGIAGCHSASPFQPLCVAAQSSIPPLMSVNSTMIPVFLGHAPAGAAVRQIAHYGQTIRRGAFARFNHNVIDNIRKYGSTAPPAFDLSRVTVPAYIYYGLADEEADWRDIQVLAERLGNTAGMFKLARDTFNHFDFIWGVNVKTELYDELLMQLKEAGRHSS